MKYLKTLASLCILCVAYPADYLVRLCENGLNYLNPQNKHNFTGQKKSPIAISGSAITSQVQIDGEFGCIHLDGFLDHDNETQVALDGLLVTAIQGARKVHEKAEAAAQQAQQTRASVFDALKTGSTSQLTIGTASQAPAAPEKVAVPAPEATVATPPKPELTVASSENAS